ncbi:MAG: sigma-70 family RNA polymerase sigma factor [Bacteroidetes bacterium]|nr:sigma-70 family RNA polymerase sigma factor [Bacteroidota bacterium]
MELNEFKIKISEIKNLIFRFARRLLGSREDAEDVVQEVFIKLWKNLENLDNKKNFNAFAMTVTKNLCIDKLRTRKGKPIEFDEEIFLGSEGNLNKSIEIADSIEFAISLIDSLPLKHKMVMHLRDIEGLEYDEIANLLGYEKNDIKVTLCRARKKIREQLTEIYEYERIENR